LNPVSRNLGLWLLLLLLLVIAGLILWLVFGRGHGKTTVPDVVGMRAPAAASRLHARHLKDSPVPAPSSKPSPIAVPAARRRW